MTEQTSDFKKSVRWHPDSSRGIIKRIIATGTLILETPAHFGAGEQSGSELIILEDALENKPLLPGASIAGALRHYLWQREKGYRSSFKPDRKSYAERLFGTALEQDKGHQSRVLVDDAPGEGSLTIRDGVKIDGVTRTAEDKALFLVQVWERGTSFELYLELCIYEDDVIQGQSAQLEQAFAVALQALGDGEIPLGARKHRGYGRAKVSNWDIQSYDMKQVSHLSAWLNNEKGSNIADKLLKKAEKFVDERHYLSIEAKLNLCDSLLIRAGSDVADVSHLTSKGEPVVSGTSIIGALRARALKIVQSIADYDDEDARHHAINLIDDMFGRHGTAESGDDLTASRLMVEEHLIENPHFKHIQNRVKIDRFTGGAFDTALFTEQPVFAKDDTLIKLVLELRFPVDLRQFFTEKMENAKTQKEYDEAEKEFNRIVREQKMVQAEAGLLMLLLKDLWTEDLPLGGESSIGRGRLRGKEACIKLKTVSESDTIKLNQTGLVDKNQGDILQKKVETLWKYLGGEA